MELVLERADVERLIDGYSRKVDTIIDGYKDKNEMLVSLLQDVQAEFGYLPRDVLVLASQKLDIPLSQVFSVATFFRAFTLRPRGRHLVTVCTGTACHVRGAQRLLDKLERDHGLTSGATSKDSRFTLEAVNCLGCCALGPVVAVDGTYERQLNPEKLGRVLEKHR